MERHLRPFRREAHNRASPYCSRQIEISKGLVAKHASRAVRHFFVNRGKIAGKHVEDLKDNPLPDGAIEEVYGGPVSENHTANFIEALKSRKQPISDVWSHSRMLEICHLSNIAMRLNRELNWDPITREITGDTQANSFLTTENRQGYEIDV